MSFSPCYQALGKLTDFYRFLIGVIETKRYTAPLTSFVVIKIKIIIKFLAHEVLKRIKQSAILHFCPKSRTVGLLHFFTVFVNSFIARIHIPYSGLGYIRPVVHIFPQMIFRTFSLSLKETLHS